MPRLVYASRFEVQTKAGMQEVLSSYRDWVVGHYRDWRNMPEFDFDPSSSEPLIDLPEGHELASALFQDGSERAVRIRWVLPHDQDAGLRWLNEIRVGQFNDRCGVEHLISIESVEYSVSPARLAFGSPRVVRDICSRSPAFVGDMQIQAEPYIVRRESLQDFLILLNSELRKLPIVLLSPYARGDLNRIDPQKLALNLAGVAVIVCIEDPELTWDFVDEVGRELSCFNGAARIYWPGFSTESSPRSHRLFLGSWIDQIGSNSASRKIEQSIFAVTAFRYIPDPRIADLIRRAEAAERQRLLSEKRETGDNFWADYERDLERLDLAEKKIEQLEAENANLKANQQVFFSLEDGPDDKLDGGDDDVVSFHSVAEATREAATKFSNLEILPSALSSADDCPFQRPDDIFRALKDLSEIVDDWERNRREKGSGGDILLHLRNRGWGKRSSMHISDTTKGKYKNHYEFEYRGEKQLFEPHITIGAGDTNSCASIHFLFDSERKKIAIGHVGRHLPNTKT
ncbi:hypothetical protein [Martelella mediterranea]|uniref:Uncharacterized protein n=1 Tax=Martelella mediterranea DSM 17316 TaxID=1122214 RepID=A0A1U9Z2S1_9HYPH|nr:hypothetical protein [Martelella mediterranea]AQZ51950.1 hypothetical protein Mame_02624 [Martelella mediterranea DSM 17316]